MGSRFERIAEEKILQAMADGLFDHLPGAGKPIEWKENPLTPEDWKIAFDVLEKNGYKLPWIDKRKEIEERFDLAIQTCERNLKYQPGLARAEFFKQVDAINHMIFDYNLIVPAVQFQKSNYDARSIFQKLKSTKAG
ncbi:MAG: DnaJ family domain-containing protein [Anaerolineaceae bacterium]